MKDLKKKIDAVLSDTPSTWAEEALWFEENKDWLDRSAEVALCVLSVLHEKGMSQKELAVLMGVSPQHVSKILKGNENLTLETISKLEGALGVSLLKVEIYRKTFSFEEVDRPANSGAAFHPESSAKARTVSAEGAMDAYYPYYPNDPDYRKAS